MRSAVVLAGGYSTRFGPRDKATARLDGRPMIRRVVDRVSPAVDEVIVNCRAEQRERIRTALEECEYRLAIDPVPDRGPVAGVRTGCRSASGRWAFVTACDMPFLRPQLPRRLFEAADDAGAIPSIDERLRPLSAVYDANAVAEACETTLERGRGAVTELIDRLSLVVVREPASPRVVADVDTRSALRAERTS